MAFVCAVEDGELRHFDVFKHGSSWVILTLVGFDDQQDRTYSAMICLEPMVGGWGDMEYTFCLVEIQGSQGVERHLWSGTETARIMGREDRRRVLKVILNATEHLLRAVNPFRVYRCTWDVNAPRIALRKHFLIAQTFETCGYEVSTSDSWHGKRIWWMERTYSGDIDSPSRFENGASHGQTAAD